MSIFKFQISNPIKSDSNKKSMSFLRRSSSAWRRQESIYIDSHFHSPRCEAGGNDKYSLLNTKSQQKKYQKGFTLAELIIVMAIFSFLLGFVTINLLNLHQKTSINTALDALIADIKQQQVKSMSGDLSGGSSNSGHGIHFESNRYTLFRGSVYSPSETSNFTITIQDSMQFLNITFPGSDIVFAPGSGEVSGFVPGSNTITLKDNESSNQKTITINRYGVITGLN